MQLFVDMDGVLADFAGHYEADFGWRPDQEDDVDWAVVRQVEEFYLNIPPMADLQLLSGRIERNQPIVLTGVPEEIVEAPANKRAWVAGLHADEARVLTAKELDNFRAAQPSLDDDLSSSVDPVNLKPVLGEIETNRDSFHGGRLLSVVAFTDDHVVAHRCRGAGAVHPIKILAPGPPRPTGIVSLDHGKFDSPPLSRDVHVLICYVRFAQIALKNSA